VTKTNLTSYAGVEVVDPMVPVLFTVREIVRELSDVFTFTLKPVDGDRFFAFEPGQFNMLYLFGIGEVPISISGDPEMGGTITHTIRTVGTVTNAFAKLRRGDTVGLRGPFGTSWPVKEAEGHDVIILTGGIGLAPLRPAIYHLLANRGRYGNICIYYGARSPKDMLYRTELEQWRSHFDLHVEAIVDHAEPGWMGRVGVVTKLIDDSHFDPHDTKVFVCGPEIMMRFAIKALNEVGVADQQVYLSLERNMKCALGFCGHCQFGPTFVCRDGPIFRFDKIKSLFNTREI
jgi:NAD(P)H-flavin reductase